MPSKDFSQAILYFCRRLNPEEAPAKVAVIPEIDAKTGYCPQNVAAKIAQDGGEALSGWDITWEEDFWIQAEAHMIWKSPTGQLLDITPRLSNESEILFVPKQGFWNGTQFIPNRRMTLEDSLRSRAYFMYGKLRDKLKQESWNGTVWTITEDQEKELQATVAKIVSRVPSWQKCPCNSGQFFGKCCGRPKGRPWSNI